MAVHILNWPLSKLLSKSSFGTCLCGRRHCGGAAHSYFLWSLPVINLEASKAFDLAAEHVPTFCCAPSGVAAFCGASLGCLLTICYVGIVCVCI